MPQSPPAVLPDFSNSPWRKVNLLTIAEHELSSLCSIHINGEPYTCDPTKSVAVKNAQGKTVGYIRSIRAEGNRIVGDVLITDPELYLKMATPPITVGFSKL